MAASPSGARSVGRTGGQNQSTETKSAVKTTELIAYIVILIALFIAGAVTSGDVSSTNGSGGGGGTTGELDHLNATKVWLYATLLTVGYMISRGLAKAGSRDPYTADNHDHDQHDH